MKTRIAGGRERERKRKERKKRSIRGLMVRKDRCGETVEIVVHDVIEILQFILRLSVLF